MKEGEDLYFDFSKEEKDYAIRFLLESVIRSRGTCGFPSNQKHFDEDVNIYLAHLLFAISTSAYQKLAQKYLVSYQSDLASLVENADDNYIKYFIYKINADNLLVHLSVFQDLAAKMQDHHQICGMNELQYLDATRSYYQQAAFYNQRIYRKRTAVGDVLAKLAKNLDLYYTVLQMTRRDFFHFANHFKDQEFSEFVRNVNEYEKDVVLKERQDKFLDLYAKWVTQQDNAELKSDINKVCEEINRLDPKFKFRIE